MLNLVKEKHKRIVYLTTCRLRPVAVVVDPLEVVNGGIDNSTMESYYGIVWRTVGKKIKLGRKTLKEVK